MSRFWETLRRKLEKTQSRNRLSGLEVMVSFFFWKVASGLFRVGFGGLWGFAGLGGGIFSGGWKFHAGRMKMNLGSNFFGAGLWGFFWCWVLGIFWGLGLGVGFGGRSGDL
jgi:hypothetical protein